MRPRILVLAGLVAALAGLASADPADFDMHRCVNLGNTLDSPKGEPWGRPIDVADFPKIRSMGVDTVRIPVRWSDYAGPGPDYAIDPAFMAEVDGIVAAALAADLNVILDVHHFDAIMQAPEEGVPELVAMWRQIGAHFAGAPDRLWFEVLNEPKGALAGEAMRDMQRAGVAAIRETNPDRIVILGGEDASGVELLDTNIPPPDANIVYTFHFYDPEPFTHQFAPWASAAYRHKRGWGSRADRAEVRAMAGMAADYREKTGRPVFLGEFGVYQGVDMKLRAKWTRAVRKQAEAADLPWCVWSYSNSFALYDAWTGTYNAPLVEALGLKLPAD